MATGSPASKVESAQPHECVGFLAAVDPGPHLDEVTPVDASVQLAATQGRQELPRRRYAALTVEENVESVWHADDRRPAAAVGEGRHDIWG